VGRYRYRPEEDYWGVGINSSRDERTTYSLTERGIRTQASLRIAGPMRVGALVDYSSNTVAAGKDKRFPTTSKLFGGSDLPGLESGAALLGAGIFAEFDRRDVVANPHKGFYARFAATSNDSVGRDDFGFINYALDARGYLPLGSTRRTLALRLLGDFNDPKGGSQVPFFRLARVGDGETLRGYDTYRFHGRHALHTSVEYRYQLASTFDEKGFGGIDALAFTDIGQVFNHRSEFSMNNLRATWGGGIQFSSARSTVLRVLYARSPEGSRLFFSFGPSF
jgi:outer membrane protein assembly factor BamA